MECDFCGAIGNWISILRDSQIVKKDGSDLILCDDCMNNYANGDYDKIKLKDVPCVNSAPKNNSQQPSELNQHTGGEHD